MLNQDQIAILNALTGIVRHAREREEEGRRYASSPTMPKENLAGAMALFRAQTATTRAPAVKQIRKAIADYRAAHVKPRPDHRPSGAARASHLAAVASIAPYLDPPRLAARLDAARERVALDELDLLVPLAQAKAAYQKPFQADTTLFNSVHRAQLALDSVPEVLATQEAAAWADRAERELDLLETTLNDGNRTMERLDAYLSTGAFAAILPNEPSTPTTPPSPSPTSSTGVTP